MKVKTLQSGDESRWNDFVRSRRDATFFHRVEWKTVLERALGHRTHYMYAERDGEICGILPLGQIRSLLFGNALISTPFCVYGGIVANSEVEQAALTEAACALAERLGVDYLEMRNLRRRHPDWPCKELYVTFRKEIDGDSQKNLTAIPRKQRAMVRKGIKQGLQSEVDAETDRFFRVYAESVRNLGTPVFPPRLFQVLREVFQEDCEILTVTKDGKPVSSVLSFYSGSEEVLPYYGGSIVSARALAANDFMYWEVMSRAVERGVRLYDFGRSKRETGSFRFKKHWGFEPAPLFYEYYMVRTTDVPEINPLNPRYRMFVEAWKRLPLPVANLLGPRIARHLG